MLADYLPTVPTNQDIKFAKEGRIERIEPLEQRVLELEQQLCRLEAALKRGDLIVNPNRKVTQPDRSGGHIIKFPCASCKRSFRLEDMTVIACGQFKGYNLCQTCALAHETKAALCACCVRYFPNAEVTPCMDAGWDGQRLCKACKELVTNFNRKSDNALVKCERCQFFFAGSDMATVESGEALCVICRENACRLAITDKQCAHCEKHSPLDELRRAEVGLFAGSLLCAPCLQFLCPSQTFVFNSKDGCVCSGGTAPCDAEPNESQAESLKEACRKTWMACGSGDQNDGVAAVEKTAEQPAEAKAETWRDRPPLL